MRPRRTHESNAVFHLLDGTEDNDLWVTRSIEADGQPTISSVWELSQHERDLIAGGMNIELTVWGESTPPVMLTTTGVELGKVPDVTD